MAALGELDDGETPMSSDREPRDDADARTTKRRRMDHLIQMSLEFAGVLEPRRDSSGNSKTDPIASEQLQQTGDPLAPSTEQRDISSTPRVPLENQVVRKRTWTAEEDAKLVDLVQRLGRDWAAIAREFPTRDRKRCRERFINHLDPALKRVPWTHAEDERLLELQRSIGSHWAQLAGKLDGRSPDDAKNRWLQLTKEGDDVPARAPPQRWTTSEEDALRSLVEANGAKDWFFVASQIPGRTDLQCRQHWYRVLAPRIVKGRATWTQEEDELLRSKVDELGPHWEKIAAFLPGRLGKQCRERYLNHLDDSVIKTPWTEDEDTVLRDCDKLYPRKWSKIALQLPGRSENAVKNRWNSLRRKPSDAPRNGG